MLCEPGAKLHQDARRMAGERSERGRGSALEKALLVLDAITEQPQPIGLPDISARIGLPRQTVHRILQQLDKVGLVSRDPSRDRYSVGPKLSRLALAALFSDNDKEPLRKVLRGLVDDVQETCNVGYLRGIDYIFLERIECDWQLRVHLQAGSSVPAYTSAAGKTILAHLAPEFRARLLNSVELKAVTENTITDVAELEKEFDRIREQGYATTVEEYTRGIAGVGVPIKFDDGRVTAALGTHGPLARLSRERAVSLVPRLQTAARDIAEIWGMVELI